MKTDDVPGSEQATHHGQGAAVSISLVIAMYRVADYLPDFLDSLEKQSLSGIDLECIFVDDGSPFDEARLASEWLTRTGTSGTVLQKENGGVSSARNAGLEQATGDWVSFPDPDDILSPSYLREIALYIGSALGQAADAVAGNLLFYIEETEEVSNTHPLSYKFDGRQNLNLRRIPHIIQLHCASTFMRRETLLRAGLRFDERLRIGEDALLLSQLLALSDEPLLGVVPQARYLYRKRRSMDSAIDKAGADPQALIDRYELGFLPLVRRLHEASRLNEWLGHVILYDLAWPFRQELSVHPMSSMMSEDQKQHLLSLIREVLGHFDPKWIHTAIKPSIPRDVRWLWHVLAAEGRLETLPTVISSPQVQSLDRRRGLLEVRYFTTSPAPSECVQIGGRPAEPSHSKTRTVDVFGQRSMYERILWVPSTGWLRFEVDGELQPLSYEDPLPKYSLFRADYMTHFTNPLKAQPRAAILREGLEKPPVKPKWKVSRKNYDGAWLFMDRVGMAQDNAEHLYRLTRRKHPEINAWFVLEQGSPDWHRLKSEGFRLTPYLSKEHIRLLLRAQHVLSSHIDREISDPLPLSWYENGERPWAFTFLQHGVTHNNLSHWFNQKDITTLVTSTRAEQGALTGDLTPYRLTTREAVLTGMPRHDALLAKAKAHDERADRNVLLIAPTWRKGLTFGTRSSRSGKHESDLGGSSYVRAWREVLRSDELRELAREHGMEIVFLPHPATREHADLFEVPDDVGQAQYGDGDIQDLLARTRTLITDYTSLAFDIAYAGMTTIYYQFDKAEVYGGFHIFVPGYFDYGRDGFGPVCTSLTELTASARELFAAHRDLGAWPSPYRERIEQTFEYRDGLSGERVLQAVLGSRDGRSTAVDARRFRRVRRLLRPLRRLTSKALGARRA